MKENNIREKVIDVYGASVSVFSDGSVHIHRTTGKRRFGNVTKKGYCTVLIRENGKEHTVFVHRLVAIAFVPNPYRKPQINHINGIKTDNRPDNLEWCTNKENVDHKINVLKHTGRRKPVICKTTGEVFDSILSASIAKGTSRGNIQSCLCGKRKTAGGYEWGCLE